MKMSYSSIKRFIIVVFFVYLSFVFSCVSMRLLSGNDHSEAGAPGAATKEFQSSFDYWRSKNAYPDVYLVPVLGDRSLHSVPATEVSNGTSFRRFGIVGSLHAHQASSLITLVVALGWEERVDLLFTVVDYDVDGVQQEHLESADGIDGWSNGLRGTGEE